MATSLRRNNLMQSDTTTAKFLYTILKQLDHKSAGSPASSKDPSADELQVDWNQVASELGITNGHAARMRFSRYRSHAEGILTQPRKPKAESRAAKKVKLEKRIKSEGAGAGKVKSEPVEQRALPEMSGLQGFDTARQPGVVKEEPMDDFDAAEPPMTGLGEIGLEEDADWRSVRELEGVGGEADVKEDREVGGLHMMAD